MNIGSVVNQSLIGIQNSRAEIAQSAQEIASASTSREPTNLAEPIVNIQAEQQVFDASARVLESADKSLGALLDTKA